MVVATLPTTATQRKSGMEHPSIFSATLGLSHPWQVVAVSFAREEKRLDITVDFTPGSDFVCRACGREVTPCCVTEETWYHHDFFNFETYLHARVPQIQCCGCGALPVERPWSRVGSRFAQIQ
jgi:hypothetical protein